MTLKEELTEAQSKISTLEAQAKNWETVKAGLEAEKLKLEGDNAKLKTDLESTQTSLKDAGTKADEQAKELKAAQDETIKLKADSKTVEQQAQEQLAAKGITPKVKDSQSGDGDGTPKSAEDFHAQYNAIEDSTERAAFYAKHSKQFLG